VAEDVNENGELLLRLHSGELVNITWGDVGYPAG
jgi:BirA family transcriptional regulator, biotin operon repressor / biotin---[acetyl-CoA-carboxylase] ligase